MKRKTLTLLSAVVVVMLIGFYLLMAFSSDENASQSNAQTDSFSDVKSSNETTETINSVETTIANNETSEQSSTSKSIEDENATTEATTKSAITEIATTKITTTETPKNQTILQPTTTEQKKETKTNDDLNNSQWITLEKQRNTVYGEIVSAIKSGGKIYMTIYSTLLLDEFPKEAWSSLNADKLTSALGATKVKINGPKYWVVDSLQLENDSNRETISVNGIELKKQGEMTQSVFDALNQGPYMEQSVVRTINFNYYKGSEVYELMSPDGSTYRMIAYTTAENSSLKITNLKTLGDTLDLPEGWSYKTSLIEQNETIKCEGESKVIVDNFGNTYQQKK